MVVSKEFYWILSLLVVSPLLVKGDTEVQADGGDDDYDDYVLDGKDGRSRETPVPPAKIDTEPSNIQVYEGDPIQLECKADNLEYYGLLWMKLPDKVIGTDGEIFPTSDSHRYEIVGKDHSILLIRNATLQDTGLYSCSVLNVSIVHSVTVNAKDRKNNTPHITLYPTGVHKVDQNDSLNLTCTVRTEGKQIEFFWQKKNQHGPKVKIEHNTFITRPSPNVAESVLMFKPVTRHDIGDYFCEFKDDFGTADSVVRLEVNFPPFIETRHDAIHSGLGKAVELRCVVHGQPKPVVTWFKKDKAKSELTQLGQRTGLQLRNDRHTYFLFITNVTKSDYASYVCEARNGFQTAGIAEIEITGKPSQPTIVEEKTKLGEEHMSYTLVWKVESTSPIESNALKYRKEPDAQWVDNIFVQATQSPNQPSFYEVTYILKNLTSSSNYVATLVSKNEFGWSIEARHHRFSINGKSYTNTLELNDDKGGKAPGTSGSIAILLSSSVFIFMARLL